MGKVTKNDQPSSREEVVELLLSNGNQRDLSVLYASAYCEFQEAQRNIQENGSVCANPRTGAPIENPYLKVRDRAELKLTKLSRRVKTTGLW